PAHNLSETRHFWRKHISYAHTDLRRLLPCPIAKVMNAAEGLWMNVWVTFLRGVGRAPFVFQRRACPPRTGELSHMLSGALAFSLVTRDAHSLRRTLTCLHRFVHDTLRQIGVLLGY